MRQYSIEPRRSNYSTRKKRGNIRQSEKSVIKMEHCNIFKLLNDSNASKVVTKNEWN